MAKTYFSGSHPRRQIGNSVFVATGNKPQIPIIGSVFTEQRTGAEKTPYTQVTINNMIVGSSVGFYKVSDGSLLLSGIVTTTSQTFSVQYLGSVNIEIRQGITFPTYKPWTTQVSLNGANLLIVALQELD